MKFLKLCININTTFPFSHVFLPQRCQFAICKYFSNRMWDAWALFWTFSFQAGERTTSRTDSPASATPKHGDWERQRVGKAPSHPGDLRSQGLGWELLKEHESLQGKKLNTFLFVSKLASKGDVRRSPPNPRVWDHFGWETLCSCLEVSCPNG